MNFSEILKTDFNILLTKKMEEQFSIYYNFLVEFNNHTNLTAITEEEEVYVKHFYDSISLCKACDFEEMKTLCDIGAGAGFPSIPLKIVFPHLEITIIDSLQKRTIFLRQLIEKLNLGQITIIHTRAEDYGNINREVFDVVTARAVARLNILSELCLPLVKVNGLFLSPKSKALNEELIEAGNAIKELGGTILNSIELKLHNDDAIRNILVIKKNHQTSKKYPRTFAQMKKKPL